MNINIPETTLLIPSDFVIIGGSGDLSVRKIIPALFWRFLDKQINNKSGIIICVRSQIRYIPQDGYGFCLQRQICAIIILTCFSFQNSENGGHDFRNG